MSSMLLHKARRDLNWKPSASQGNVSWQSPSSVSSMDPAMAQEARMVYETCTRVDDAWNQFRQRLLIIPVC